MNGLSHEPCGVVRSIDSFLSEHMHYFTKLKQRLRPFWRPLTRFLQFVRGVQEISVKCIQTFLNPAPAFCFCIWMYFKNFEIVKVWYCDSDVSSCETLRSEIISRVCLVHLNQYIYFLSVIVSLEVSGLFVDSLMMSFDLFSVIGAKRSESCWVWGVTLSSVFCVDNLNSIYLNTKMMRFWCVTFVNRS